METTGGWGVALSVGPVSGSAPDRPPAEPGVTRRRTRLSEIVAPESFDGAGCARELRAVADMRAQLDAYELAVVARLADLRPDLWDLTADDPGARAEGWTPTRTYAGVTEFFVDEVALVLGISRTRADTLANTALVLTGQLRSTWEALADGRIDTPRAQALVAVLGWQAPGHVDTDVVLTVEREALAWALAGESAYRLRDRTAALLLEVDAAAADRRRVQAQRNADVQVRRGTDGMAQLICDMTGPVAAACRDAVDTYARMWKSDGDTRPIGQLRALVAADLILRPWDTSRESVTAHLTVLAPLPSLFGHPAGDACHGGHPATDGPPTTGTVDDPRVAAGGGAAEVPDACGTADGQPITAAHLRELLTQLDALCPGGLQPPSGGSLSIDLTDPTTGRLRATLTREELRRAATRGCTGHPDPPPRRGRRRLQERSCDGIGHDDRRQPPATARPDAPRTTSCSCAVLGVPSRTDSYRPTTAQRRHVTARDRGCRHPGCSRPAARTDLDHVEPWAPGPHGGDTDCANLCCLCRRHHRLKTHAPGWRYVMTPDGALTVTTPSGVSRTTSPPGTGAIPPDDLLVPPERPRDLLDDAPPRSPGPGPDDDPPPF